MVIKMNIKNINDEISKFTTCKACRGRGGRYIVSKSKKKKQNTEVIFEKCSFCEGKGRVEDKRSREEKLDDWQNETNIWINCKDCDADGYIVDDDGNEFVCQTCEGYGVVKDKRTPEGREAERIEIEKIKFQEGLLKLYSEEDDDFYGDNKKIKNLEDELNSIKASVKKLEETHSNKTTSILQEIHELSKTIGWISVIAVFLIFAQCSEKTDDLIKEGVKVIREDIESLDRSIDVINDRIKKMDNKRDNFNFKKNW